VAIGVAAVALLAVLVAALVFLAAGGRWFVVATPSMGTTAPVGTLVLTSPTVLGALHSGDIISFHPPTAPGETYTHRIVNISPEGDITTKGDINGAVDPWTLHGPDLIGKATTVLPAVGWLARGLPILVIGGVLVFLLTRLVRSLQWRAALRIVGAALVVSVAAFVLRPFTGVEVLQTYVADGKAGATVVSTGLLPIRVTAEHGNHVDLLTGQVGQLSIPTYLEDGYYRMSSALHLDLLGWIAFLLVCCIPLIGTMIFGLPPKETFDGEQLA
jgi:signal peptidase I